MRSWAGTHFVDHCFVFDNIRPPRLSRRNKMINRPRTSLRECDVTNNSHFLSGVTIRRKICRSIVTFSPKRARPWRFRFGAVALFFTLCCSGSWDDMTNVREGSFSSSFWVGTVIRPLAMIPCVQGYSPPSSPFPLPTSAGGVVGDRLRRSRRAVGTGPDTSTALPMVFTTPESVIEQASTQMLLDDLIDESVRTSARKPIMMQFQPTPYWIWRRWRGTIFSESWISCVRNMLFATLVAIVFEMYPSLKLKLNGFNLLWGQLLSVTTFTLTFFLNVSYGLWRKCYELSRRLQGRLNDLGLTMAAHADRTFSSNPDEPSTYTPAARQVLELMARYVRLFNLLCYASFTRSHRPILTPTGMRRLVDRGLITPMERQVLVDAEVPATQRHNNVLLWMVRVFEESRQAGHLNGGSGFEQQFMEKIHVIRSQYGAIGDELQGRMPLAYAHIVQVLVDVVLWMYPFMAYTTNKMSAWLGVLGTGLLTIFYQGLFDLAKQFLDPYDNENYGNGDDPLCVDTLVAETNAGSVRWMNGVNEIPFNKEKLKEGDLGETLLPLRGISLEQLREKEELLEKKRKEEEERLRKEMEEKESEDEGVEADGLFEHDVDSDVPNTDTEPIIAKIGETAKETTILPTISVVKDEKPEVAEATSGDFTARDVVTSKDTAPSATGFDTSEKGTEKELSLFNFYDETLQDSPSIAAVAAAAADIVKSIKSPSAKTDSPTAAPPFVGSATTNDSNKSSGIEENKQNAPPSLSTKDPAFVVTKTPSDTSPNNIKEESPSSGLPFVGAVPVPTSSDDKPNVAPPVTAATSITITTTTSDSQTLPEPEFDTEETEEERELIEAAMAGLDGIEWFEEIGPDGQEIRLSQMLADEVWEEELETEKEIAANDSAQVDDMIQAAKEEFLETEAILNVSPGFSTAMEAKPSSEGVVGTGFITSSDKGGTEQPSNVGYYDQTKLSGIAQLWGAGPDELDGFGESPLEEEPLPMDSLNMDNIFQLWGDTSAGTTSTAAPVAPDTTETAETNFDGVSQLWGDALSGTPSPRTEDTGSGDGDDDDDYTTLDFPVDAYEGLDWFNEVSPDGKEVRLSQMLADEVWEEEIEEEVPTVMTYQETVQEVMDEIEAAEAERLETEAILIAPPGAQSLGDEFEEDVPPATEGVVTEEETTEDEEGIEDNVSTEDLSTDDPDAALDGETDSVLVIDELDLIKQEEAEKERLETEAILNAPPGAQSLGDDFEEAEKPESQQPLVSLFDSENEQYTNDVGENPSSDEDIVLETQDTVKEINGDNDIVDDDESLKILEMDNEELDIISNSTNTMRSLEEIEEEETFQANGDVTSDTKLGVNGDHVPTNHNLDIDEGD